MTENKDLLTQQSENEAGKRESSNMLSRFSSIIPVQARKSKILQNGLIFVVFF